MEPTVKSKHKLCIDSSQTDSLAPPPKRPRTAESIDQSVALDQPANSAIRIGGLLLEEVSAWFERCRPAIKSETTSVKMLAESCSRRVSCKFTDLTAPADFAVSRHLGRVLGGTVGRFRLESRSFCLGGWDAKSCVDGIMLGRDTRGA